ncbi:hypothetical protein HDU93_005220 [Gonapodya sp. JEL0774]|nr:hypothetical protein HDU93_005220 [Gonapodya sp. JEL0774]
MSHHDNYLGSNHDYAYLNDQNLLHPHTDLHHHMHHQPLPLTPYEPDPDQDAETRSAGGDEANDDDDDDNVQIGEAPPDLSDPSSVPGVAGYAHYPSPAAALNDHVVRSSSHKSADESLTDTDKEGSTYSADSTSLRDRDSSTSTAYAHSAHSSSATPTPAPSISSSYTSSSNNYNVYQQVPAGRTSSYPSSGPGYGSTPASASSSGGGGGGYGQYPPPQQQQMYFQSSPPSQYPSSAAGAGAGPGDYAKSPYLYHSPSSPSSHQSAPSPPPHHSNSISANNHLQFSPTATTGAYPSSPTYPSTVPSRTTSRSTVPAGATPSKPPTSSSYGSVFSLSRFREMLAADLGDRDDVKNWVPRIAGWDDEIWGVAPGSVWLSAPHLVDGLAGGLPADAWDPVEDDTPDLLIPTSDKGAVMSTVTRTQSRRSFEVWNLYDTEINYAKDLDTLLTVFRPRMVAMKEAVSDHAVKIVFAGVEELQKLHAKFLADLDRMCRQWDDDASPLGKLFLDYTEDWDQGYRIFIENFGTTLKEIQALEKNADFRQFLQDTEQSPETKRQNLKSYLLFPVQRVMRYQLLLQSIIKNSDDSHPDMENLKKAREVMLSFANKVNERKKQAEETAGLFRAHEATEGCPPTIISSHRRLVTEAEVIDQGTKKDLHLFLFSDMLMIARVRKAGTTTIMGISFTKDEGKDKGDEKPYKFVRFLDFRDITLEPREKGPATVLRIILNFKKGERTETTFETGVVPAAETKLFTFVFPGAKEDGEKGRNQFHMAVENEMKRALRT